MTSIDNIGILQQPKQARSRDLVDKICGAAVALAQESGVLALNTNSIASGAGVDISSL
ncbi:MAG: hypothetical protein P8L70_05535 [Halioglobus sp.]|nr:hypothetical protein [Halioglobus sp.]MDG2326176.1 hypothetical protein [Halioglobus sp.]